MYVMLEQSLLVTSLCHTHLYPQRGGHATALAGDSTHALLSPDDPVYLMAVPVQMCGFTNADVWIYMHSCVLYTDGSFTCRILMG